MNEKRSRIAPTPLCCSLTSYSALTKHPDSIAGDWAASRCLAKASALGGTQTRISGLVKAELYSVKLRGLSRSSRAEVVSARVSRAIRTTRSSAARNEKRGRIAPAPLCCSLTRCTAPTKFLDCSAVDYSASRSLVGASARGGTQTRIFALVGGPLYSIKLHGLNWPSRAQCRETRSRA